MRKDKVTFDNGTVTAYMECGTGTPIVFIHGNTGNKEMWTPHMEELGKDFHCFAYDLIGHGETELGENVEITPWTLAEQTHELLEKLGIRDCVLFGHSLGGEIMFGYLTKYGCENLKGLIFADATPYKSNTDTWNLGSQGGIGADDDVLKMKTDFRQYMWNLFLGMNQFEAEKEEDVKQLFEAWIKPLKADQITRIFEVCQMDLRPALDKVTVPFAYLYADPGSMLSPGLASYYGERLKVPYYPYRYDCVSHGFPLECPKHACADIKDFMSRLD